MKSKLEIRQFAVAQAVMVLGMGSKIKDVVEKAREIADFIIGDADIPEVDNNDVAMMRSIGDALTSLTK